MYRDAKEWSKIHDILIGDAPQPLELADETTTVVAEQAKRVRAGLSALRGHLEAYKPSAIVTLVSDSGRMFSNVQVPQFSTFTGDKMWGSTRLAELGENAADDVIELQSSTELSGFVQQELVAHGFDMSYNRELNPQGQPEFGVPESLVTLMRALTPDLKIPVVAIFVNSHVSPSPSGRRCRELGEALGEILDEPEERIALVASGGLSHDHHGSRAGWIDHPFDEWTLNQLTRGKGANLDSIWDLESDSIHGGVAEVRLWAAVAGACESLGSKAVVDDYFASYTAATGLGFVHWPIAK
jgi:protocatechuate 4,5-dioxygenase beta chain